ncbi:MAG: type I-C CRISPR-associated protein Cas5c [Muribaculaceae bacterium]|nr:type I-C CRISPR-associated protein Cas5c [Muribaculaceae bacterium]
MEYTDKEFCLEVWGDMACFTRPEMKVERVSYDVITPSAARAIFEAILWKPAISWQVTRIDVLNPIKWISVRRNEVGAVATSNKTCIYIEDARQQKSGLLLKDVRYRIYAKLIFIPVRKRIEQAHESRDDENPMKYYQMFERRSKRGQCFNQPYLGCREFSANFRYIEKPEEEALNNPAISQDKDLSIMLYDMDFNQNPPMPMFFRAKMNNGVIIVPPINSEEVLK